MDGGVVLPQLMGVINVTPDSFSDGGRHLNSSVAVDAALQMASEGADWVDIGGESTRPGSSPVSIDEEIRRVIPVIEQIKQADPTINISIDTSKAAVAETAIAAGATMVNDITALGDPHMADLCAAHDVRLVLMHMRGAPKTMQDDTQYDQLEDEVESDLIKRIKLARSSGVSDQNIILDPPQWVT